MSAWNDLKVKTKLLIMIGGFCLALLVVGGIGVINIRTIGAEVGTVSGNMDEVALLSEMKNRFLSMRLDLVYMIALSDEEKLKAKEASFLHTAEELQKEVAAIPAEGLTGAKKEQMEVFRQGLAAYVVEGKKLAEMAKDPAQRSGAAAFATASVAPLYEKPAKAIAALVEGDVKLGATLRAAASASSTRAVLMVGALVVSVSLFGLLVGLAIAGSITRPLKRVLGVLENVASGDLVDRSDITSRDEMGQLGAAVNTMADRIHAIICQVATSTTQVASAATELYSTAETMATGAEQVASQAGTIATAGEEMAATSGEIAQNCTMAAESSSLANDTAGRGAEVVEQTVTIMRRIAERVRESAVTVETLGSRSDQIGAIIGTIEDIADQTNLLALNAAIEAARAGEQGRGFAVVADEVRALAERTTRATKEISAMIKAIQSDTKGAVAAMNDGVREVESGTVEATRSGEALQTILNQIGNVTMQVSQIATAAEQQTCTTGEISNNMQQITEVVAQTAKGAHESATAASQLAQLANDLEHVVRQFKLAA